jgi:hypothetical protein
VAGIGEVLVENGRMLSCNWQRARRQGWCRFDLAIFRLYAAWC